MVASIELSTIPIDVVSCSRNIVCRVGELVNRSEFDYRLDLILKQHGQHNVIARLHFEQRGADRNGSIGHLGDEHPPLVDRALADDAFADTQRLRMAVSTVIRIGRQQLEALSLLTFGLIDHALVCVDERSQLRKQEVRPTVVRSRWPCSMLVNFARLVFSQSCSVLRSVVSRKLSIMVLMLSLSSATSPRAST